MQGHCQYGRRGQRCPNQHPSMCFKFLRYGTRGCNKLDCTYSHPKMCKQLVDATTKTTIKQPQTQATQWDFPIATQSIFPQTYPSTNYHHLPTQHPTVETITPKPNSNSQSVTNPFLDQMNAIKQLMLDMQQAQSKLLLTMNQAWPLLQTN